MLSAAELAAQLHGISQAGKVPLVTFTSQACLGRAAASLSPVILSHLVGVQSSLWFLSVSVV